MKNKIRLVCLVAFIPLLIVLCPVRGIAQADELAELALDIEKLSQFKSILSDMKAGYDILTKGYNVIKDISQGNFNLHNDFLNSLLAVNPVVAKYKKVAEIIQMEGAILKEYKSGLQRCTNSKLFSSKELDYLIKVFDKVNVGTLDRLDELIMYITAGQVRMSDEERLKGIDAIHADLTDRLDFVRSFNVENQTLVIQRVKEMMNLDLLKKQTGISDSQ